jgi:hypothetical protein
MPSPLTLSAGVSVRWNIPEEIATRTDIDEVKLFRSGSENTGYTEIAVLPSAVGNVPQQTYYDATGSRGSFYLVTFVATTVPYESSYNVTYFEPLPRELRLIAYIRSSMPDILNKSTVCQGLTDNDYLAGLQLALQIFNSYPPQTSFTLDGFPRSHEFFLVGLAQMTTIASRYLPVSIRDWSYAEPGGVSMTLDRGAKMNAAIQVIANVYTQYLPLLKLDFGHEMPCGLGTIQLPLSMGGVVSRGILNILDIFTATGR